MEKEGYFYVFLSSGTKVNILTTDDGADTFLREESSLYLESNVQHADRIRKQFSQGRMDKQDYNGLVETLVRHYAMLDSIADNASENSFALVSSDHLDGFITHACGVFSDLSMQSKWTKTGVLQRHDLELLGALICHMKHASFVKRVLESNLLDVLALLCSGRKGAEMPCPDVTESILSITNNFRVALESQEWEREQIFKVLESNGLLAQVLRCITQPSPHPAALQGHLEMIDELNKCQLLVRKKLKPGQPTGDVLADVVSGKSGYSGRRDQQVVTRLRNLQLTAVAFNEKMGSSPMIGKVCRNCGRSDLSEEFQSSLLACSRCKKTYYCSKSCQLADWSIHKMTCTPLDQALENSAKGGQDTIMAFVTSNYYDIMKEIIAITQKENVQKRKLVLEIDFFANDGSAPALRDPPEFKIGVTKRYLKGERPDEPNWFHKGSDVYDDNIKSFLVSAKDQYRRMTDDHLLTFVRYSSGTTGVNRICLQAEENGPHFFSDKAYDAFARALIDDDSQLEAVFGEAHARKIMYNRHVERIQDRMKRCLKAA